MKRSYWGEWLGGLVFALLAGGGATLITSIASFATQRPLAGLLLGLLPGIGLLVLARRSSRNGLAQGLLTGACLITLAGSACGFQAGGITGL